METKNIKVDVIVPSYHPGREFPVLLKRLYRQDYPIHRLIVMNTEEKYWRPEWEELYPGLEVHHLKKEEFDHGGTRRQAVELSDADIFVFMTQDAVPADKTLIRSLIRPILENEKVGAAYARQLPRDNCSFIERYTRAFNYPEESRIRTASDLRECGIKTFFCSNVCAAYRSDLYRELGGFAPRAIFNEDMIYAGNVIKAGYGIAYAADAQVIHSHNYSAVQQFHRNFDLGVSQAEHPEIFADVSSEGEGIRLVKQTLRYLIKQGRAYLIPGVVLQSGCKYAGYLLGKNHQKLPGKVVLFCTMNRSYWK